MMIWICIACAPAVIGILAWEPEISWETVANISRVWPKDDGGGL